MSKKLLSAAGWKKAIFVFLLLTACAQAPIVGNNPRLIIGNSFRHRWWNYYNRGLEAAERRDFAAAQADLEAALQRRQRDQRMARTYGMHYCDYFPNREMGVIAWLIGDFQVAQAFLERSIEQYPTAKARFYLDRVRKALIERNSMAIDPPEVNFSLPAEPFRTRDDPIRLSGSIFDPNYVAAVTIDGLPLFVDGAQTRFDFDRSLSLPQGRHTVTLMATNLAGKTAQRSVDVIVDRQGPLVMLESITPEGAAVHVSGVALDEAGVSTLLVNHVALKINPAVEVPFSLILDSQEPLLEIQAFDRMGNMTCASAELPVGGSTAESGRLVAATGSLAGIFGPGDQSPPVIRLEDWGDNQIVYADKVVLSGSIRDNRQVEKVTINGQALPLRNGIMVFFSHCLSLDKGANQVTLTARDAAGNSTKRRISITRQIPKTLLLSERLRLAVLPFEEQMSSMKTAFQDAFVHNLVQLHRFQIVERERLDLILQEQQLANTRLIDQATAVRLGRLATAQAIVTGRQVQTSTGTEIVSRVIDSETGEILSVSDAYSEASGLTAVKELAQPLALKIQREFPLVDGLVLAKQKQIIFTDLNQEKLRAQKRILVYKDTPVRHFRSNLAVGFDHQVLGCGRVIQQDDKISKVELLNGNCLLIEPGDKVIPQ
jgi:hypothetical protein